MLTPKSDISTIHSIEHSVIHLTAACDMMQLLNEHLTSEVQGMKKIPIDGITENLLLRIHLALSQIVGIQTLLHTGLEDLQNLVEDA